MAGKKHFDFFELFRQDKGRFITHTDHIDEFTTIRGLAARGTLDSDTAWLLERTIVENGVIVDVEYADDARFSQSWDDRLLSFGPPANGSGAAPGDTNYFIPPVRIFTSDGTNFSPTGGGSTGLFATQAIVSTGWTQVDQALIDNVVSLNIQNNTGQEVRLKVDDNTGGYEGMVLADQQERIYTLFPKTVANSTFLLYARSQTSSVTLDYEVIAQ